MDDLLEVKYKNLIEDIQSYGRAVVAFSGGVDSTFLLWAAKEVLGENVKAVTAVSVLFPERETSEADEFCRKIGVEQIKICFDALSISGFKENPANRCYICKKELFGEIKKAASELNIDSVLDGSNVDDDGDYRPGLQAIKELEIKSPLKEAGLTKQEIRDLSKEFGLPTWSKPSFACLASRFPYDEAITQDKLKMVEKSERFLMDLGFLQMRVRIHGSVARIELLPEDFGKFMNDEIRKLVYSKFKEFGFSYVALDLLGYRTGSMNETINKDEN